MPGTLLQAADYPALPLKRILAKRNKPYMRNVGFNNMALATTEPLIFVHIPKTAGSSFRKGIDALLGPEASCRDYGLHSRQTSQEVRAHIYEEPDHWHFRAAFRAAERVFLTGHYPLMRYGNLFGVGRVVTFVREPVQRVISEYRHHVRHYHYQQPLMTFCRTPKFINQQSKMLKGAPLDAIGLVAITERYDESLDLLESMFGIRPPRLEDNLGRQDLAEIYKPTPEEETEIRALNADDLALYEAAKTLFARRLEALQSGRHYVRGRIDSVEKDRINGWAVRDGDDAPVRLDVLVDGKLIGQTMATEFRPVLKAHGLGRGGYIGFSLRAPSLAPNSVLSCRVSDTNTELSNSPYKISPP